MTSPIKRGITFGDKNSLTQSVIRGLSSVRKETRKGGRLYSSDGAMCPRKDVIINVRKRLLGEAEYTWTAVSEFYTQVGETMHNVVRNGLQSQNKLFGIEEKIPDIEINLAGYIDAIIEDEGALKVLEIKSCGVLPVKEKPQHRNQAILYSISSGLPATILYVSRKVAGYDKQLMMTTFDIWPSEDECTELLTRLCLARAAYMKQSIPRIPDYFTDEKHCETIYCPFTKNCWGGINDEKIKNRELSVIEEIEMRNIARSQASKILWDWHERRSSFLGSLRKKLPKKLDRSFLDISKNITEIF